jgi:hypothetical protein
VNPNLSDRPDLEAAYAEAEAYERNLDLSEETQVSDAKVGNAGEAVTMIGGSA